MAFGSTFKEALIFLSFVINPIAESILLIFEFLNFILIFSGHLT